MHRRKQSADRQDDDEPSTNNSPSQSASDILVTSRSTLNGLNGSPSTSPTSLETPPRTRVVSNPTRNSHSPLGNANGRLNSVSPLPHSPPSQQQTMLQSSYTPPPMSAGPYRTSFADSSAQHSPSKSYYASNPSSPRTFQHHQRSQSHYSVKAPASPLNPSFSYNQANHGSPPSSSSPRSHLIPTRSKSPYLHTPPSSSTAVDGEPNGDSSANGSAAVHRDIDSRRHGRIHSRNLSIFFPRPDAGGAISTSTIEEDDGQEIEYPEENGTGEEILLSSDSGGRNIGSGFSFGAKPPISPRLGSGTGPAATKPKRRGHHHKHSVSHNFFSFMQPTSSQQSAQSSANQLESTDTSSSPWKGMTESSSTHRSALPTPTTTSFPSSTQLQYMSNVPGTNGPTIAHKHSANSLLNTTPNSGVLKAKIFAFLEFGIGAWLWAEGQRRGILSCTGLGYWVVFDAVGVWLGGVLGRSVKNEKRTLTRSYGARRIETVALFAQAIYLIFASVYVCKEAAEHMLLATGSGMDPGDSHHGHAAGESDTLEGLVFPSAVLWLSICSLLSSSFLFSNHSRILEATGSHVSLLAPFAQVIPSLRQNLPIFNSRLLTNPFSLAPLAFGISILGFDLFLDQLQHHSADVVMASIETVVTFYIAYPAAVALGKVLLQTAPERGLPGGQMEAFLRLMRELENHPQILHLPAPHLWQLTPVPPNLSITSSAVNGNSGSPYRSPTNLDDDDDMMNEEGTLVATVQIHVRKDIDDADVLELTSYVWQRCTNALGVASAGVTVSFVKG